MNRHGGNSEPLHMLKDLHMASPASGLYSVCDRFQPLGLMIARHSSHVIMSLFRSIQKSSSVELISY